MRHFDSWARRIGALGAAGLLAGCVSINDPQAVYTSLELTNSLSIVREKEIVEIPLTEVRARFKAFDETNFSVHLLPSNWYEHGDPLDATNPPPTIPAQVVDRDGDGKPDTLVVICDFAAGEKRQIAIASPFYSSLAKRSGPRVAGGLWQRDTTHRDTGGLRSEGHYVAVSNVVLEPQHRQGDGLYQFGGPVFETENLAYRFLFDSRLCFDVIGKRERGLVLQNDAAAAMDPIDLTHVAYGGSLIGEPESFGAGAFGAVENGSVVPISSCDSCQYRLIRNGPAALEVELNLIGAHLGHETTNLTWHITQYAGSRFLRHDIVRSSGGQKIAFAMNEGGGTRRQEKSGELGWLRASSWGSGNVKTGVGGALGLCILASGRSVDGYAKDPADLLGVVFDANARHFTFYTGAAWDQEPAGMRSAQDWAKAIDDFAARLNTPIQIVNLAKVGTP